MKPFDGLSKNKEWHRGGLRSRPDKIGEKVTSAKLQGISSTKRRLLKYGQPGNYRNLQQASSRHFCREVHRGRRGMLLYPGNYVTRQPPKYESRRQPNCFRQAESCRSPGFAMDETETTIHYRLLKGRNTCSPSEHSCLSSENHRIILLGRDF